jgi:hypothetical protein
MALAGRGLELRPQKKRATPFSTASNKPRLKLNDISIFFV